MKMKDAIYNLVEQAIHLPLEVDVRCAALVFTTYNGMKAEPVMVSIVSGEPEFTDDEIPRVISYMLKSAEQEMTANRMEKSRNG